MKFFMSLCPTEYHSYFHVQLKFPVYKSYIIFIYISKTLNTSEIKGMWSQSDIKCTAELLSQDIIFCLWDKYLMIHNLGGFRRGLNIFYLYIVPSANMSRPRRNVPRKWTIRYFSREKQNNIPHFLNRPYINSYNNNVFS